MKRERPYAQFCLVEETATDGWRLGTIMSFVGHAWGDAFVEAPDGSRAGVVWILDSTEFKVLQPADEDRWGVYQVPFAKPMSGVNDLVENFRAALPQLRRAHAVAHGQG